MDLQLTSDELAFRAEVRAFLLANIPASIRQKVMEERVLSRDEIVQSHRILHAAGYAVPHWPVQWGGRDWSPVRRAILMEEIEYNAVPNPLPFNTALIGPVIATFGSDEQKRRFLPAIANLDLWFCQGFSEPNAGSDLASLSTRAVLEGETYLVNGQKLWTTYAQYADWMFALVRTDPAAKRQQGITFLLIDMKSPGVTVRPITTIDGLHSVNEVFLDDVVVPVENRVGEENRGWDYAKFLLSSERVSIAHLGLSKRRLERVRRVAQERRVWEDPHFRRDVIAAEVALKALEITQYRVLAQQNPLDPKASLLKIKGSELQQRTTQLLLDAMGPAVSEAALSAYFGYRKVSIFGGSNEIQRTILARSVLGL